MLTSLKAGQTVHVSFRVSPADPEERTVASHVVRTEANTQDSRGLWPHRVSLAFRQPVAELENFLRPKSERLRTR